MQFDLKQWSQFGVAFAVGVSLSAGYVALAAQQHDEPPVIVVEERCPDTDERAPKVTEDTLGLTHDPAFYGMSKAELERMAGDCDIRDDAPAPLTDELAAELGLTEQEREAWEQAVARVEGTGVARRFIMLEALAPELDGKQLGVAEQEAKILELARATKRPEDAQLHRLIAQERAGLRRAPKSDWDKDASAWARWERYRLSRGDRFASELAVDLGRIRVDELRRKFGGWPGEGERQTGCEAPADSNDPINGMSVGEGLPRPIVDRIIKAHLSELRACHERGLESDPDLGGTGTIAFSVDASGKVVDVGVAGDLEHETTRACVREAVEGWIFPKPQAGATVAVTYPVNLGQD